MAMGVAGGAVVPAATRHGGGEDMAELAGGARREGGGASAVVDHLARYAWRILLLALGFDLVAGAVIALLGRSGGGEFLLHIQVQTIGFFLALALSLPSLVAGLWDCARGQWGAGACRLLAFAGPVVVVLGAEIGSHLLVPCGVTRSLGWGTPDWGPSPCGAQAPTALGYEVFERIHQLHHTLLAGVPIAALYWLALRRWHPAALGATGRR